MKPFNPIALIGRHGDQRVAECMRTLVEHLCARKLTVLVDTEVATALGPCAATGVAPGHIAKQARLVIAIGGAGTMLYAAARGAEHGIPLIEIGRASCRERV